MRADRHPRHVTVSIHFCPRCGTERLGETDRKKRWTCAMCQNVYELREKEE